MMDHPRIDDEDIVGRYGRGELEGEEADAFEDHLLVCTVCQRALESEERFAEGIRTLGERGELGEAETGPESSAQRAPSGKWALAWAASVLLALLPTWFVLRQNQALEDRLVEATKASEPASSMASTAELEALREQLKKATRPRVDAPILRLAPTRSAGSESEPVHRLTLSAEPEWIILLLEPPEPLAERYTLELEGPEGESAWEQESAVPDARGALPILLWSEDLEAGIHHLRATPEDGGSTFEVAVRLLRL